MLSTPTKNSPQWFREGLDSAQQRFANAPLQAASEGLQPDKIERAIESWLQQSYPPTTGKATPDIYRKILASLRTYLQTQDLDLDSPARLLTPHIATWAALRTAGSKRQGS